MAKLPSFQFYPGDWLKDPELQSCSSSARGALMNALCYAFESEQRGVLGTTVAPFSVRKVAKLCGVSRRILNALLTAKVLKVARRSGAIFSARMVRDELLRRRRARFGRRGGLSKTQAKGKQNTKQKAPPSSSSSSSPSSSDGKRNIAAVAAGAPVKRKTDPLSDAWRDQFYSEGVPKSQGSKFGKEVRDLRSMNAKPEDVAIRAANYVAVFGVDVVITSAALAKHWTKCKAGKKQSGARIRTEAGKERFRRSDAAAKLFAEGATEKQENGNGGQQEDLNALGFTESIDETRNRT